ncbi:MAG: DNA repair protein RecN [Trichlorobacter sp.]|nr:DNA repair protein RecN [Trichlorobacter sp.]
MLTHLSIHNIAIIQQLQLSFESGLTIFTGETGAGKSIIIDALSLVSGGRATAELIRSGVDEAVVEALFDISNQPEISLFLENAGIANDGELLVKRILNRSGRNRIYLNGSMATLAQLTEIGSTLVTIHGQHESQTLLKPDSHPMLLDSFAGCHQQRDAVAAAFNRWQQLKDKLEQFDQQEREAAQRLDLISWQAEEIEKAALQEGEDEELNEQQQLLAHAGKLTALTGNAFEALYGGEQTVLGDLRKLCADVQEAAAIDASLDDTARLLEDSFLQLEDIALRLRDYGAKIEADPGQLSIIEDRIDLLHRLKRKYAPTIGEIIALGRKMAEERDELLGRSRSREELEHDVTAAREKLEQMADKLSTTRKKAAKELTSRLVEEVRQLAMPHAEITVVLERLPQLRASGNERVEFLFSPNPGELPRPLGKVASGGELSRLMLAFKQILPEGEAPTIVFDEVDTGIGGAVATVVGRKLKNVSAGQQVFCITHLPQVAAFADEHLRVEKQVTDGRTGTRLTLLEKAGRVDELARMMAGESITETAREHAAGLLQQAANS